MFDLAALSQAIATHGRVVRVVIAAHDGSSPREVGASMLVWDQGQSGTIGGGALEYAAAAKARALWLACCCKGGSSSQRAKAAHTCAASAACS